MKDFSKEALAYALQNAIEFGKANPGKVLPKLFQHGLEKKDIKDIMPLIKKAVSEVNGMSSKERLIGFEKLKKIVKKQEFKERALPELPNAEKGKVVLRLAPFPSGALHLGNAKTYLLNALYAEKYDGKIILVMDDTIGSSEKPLSKDAYGLIENAFKWLGVKYEKKIIYKSDRLKIYYKYAKSLIAKNKAYVCHCPQDELRENRARGVECGCRHFPPGIQLLRWKEMFDMKEGHGTLRIKTNMMNPNPAFRDRVLFKISDREHPRVGKKYRVWPSLEMSWAIDDHLLGITHIIRGNDLRMETEMEKFIWDIFRWKHIEVTHSGYVRIEGATIGKSKSQKQVLSGEFVGWDDPRTWSIQSLARRGFTPKAIREFVEDIGLNKQDITIPIDILYAFNRRILDKNSERYSFVLNPVKISVKNSLDVREIDVPVHPDTPEITRKTNVGKNIYVSKDDFKNYEGREIRLLHLFNLRLKEKTEIGSVENKKIPKINWVSDGLKTRIFMPDGTWLSGLADSNIRFLKKDEVIQFERFAFVRYDQEKNGIREFWFGHK